MSRAVSRADFYIVTRGDRTAGWRYGCRLVEKAYKLGHRVYVHLPADHVAAFDDLLWTFSSDSFVPHAVYPAEAEDDSPVYVGAGGEPPEAEVLVQLAPEVPAFFERFARVVEIVTPEDREAARQRYRFYREQRVELHNHEVG
ncbi:MAG: DNA polymerase III subunit chi [Candidatus Competibacterales bacterium]